MSESRQRQTQQMAAAWKAWTDGEEGQRCAKPIGAKGLQEKYMRNRLFLAFIAGAEAALQIAMQTPAGSGRQADAEQ